MSWADTDLSAVRRVVTGQAPDGRSAVLFDDTGGQFAADAQYEGVTASLLWRTPAAPDLTASEDGAIAYRRLPVGGTQLYVVTIAPGAQVPFHTTNTYEHHCVVAGEIVCLLEAGEVTVRAGEVLVVRGSPHGWANRTDEPWTSVVTMVGGSS